jgi:hypothetical protein
MVHPDAPPGKSDKYARPERERRFLLAEPPPGSPIHRSLIEDRYVLGTRLRLRRMTDVSDAGHLGAVSYKLTQKIPGPSGMPGLITTLYLSAAEYAALARMPAASLRKVRASFPPFGVDTFEGPLRGLVLAEAEFDSDLEQAAFTPEIATVAEVTADERFTGGRLVVAAPEDLRGLLAGFGSGRERE